MKAREIRDLEPEELAEKLAELKKQLFNLRFQHNVGQLENTTMLSNVKRDIARLYTISREKNVNIR